MRKILKVVVFLIFGLFSTLAFANETVKVGWFPYEGLQTFDENGNPRGYNYDYLSIIASLTDYNFEYVIDSYENCLSMLNSGKIDLLGCVPDYEKTANLCNFSDLWEPLELLYLYGKAETVMELQKTPEVFSDIRLGFLEGKTVAVLKNSPSIYAFKDFLEEKDLYNVVLIECSDEETIRNFVQSDFVDFGISSKLLDSTIFRGVSEFYDIPLKFAVSKNNKLLLDKLNAIAVKVASTQPWIYSDLYFEYGIMGRGLLAFTDEEKQFIDKHNKIQIAWAETSEYLFERSRVNDKFHGFFPDVFAIISEMSGIQFEYIECKTLTEVVELTQENPGNVICFIDKKAGLSGNLPFDYSSPIISLGFETIRLQKPIGNSNKTGVLQEKGVFKALEWYSENNFIEYKSEHEALRALDKGEIYQIIANTHTAYSIFDDSKNYKYFVKQIPNESLDLCFAQSNLADSKLLTILSKVINAIPKLEMNRTIIKSAIHVRNEYYQNLMEAFPWFMLVLAIFVFVVITVFLIFSLIKKSQYSKVLSTELYTDSLTTLLSQKGFDYFVEERLRRYDCKDWSVIAFDMDGFGYFNALFGFEAGDALLQDIAKICIKQCPHEELCARINNDNFYLFVNEAENSVENRIELLKNEIHNIVPNYRIHLPFGVFRIKDFKQDTDESVVLLTAANIRDYAKAAQRTVKGDAFNEVGYYDFTMHKKIVEENTLTAEMENAIKMHEFIPYFQPKYDCNQVIRGAEALVRWKKPNGELVLPAKFIPVFERNGFVLKLDMYIFEETCKVLQNQKARGFTPVPISTNFSKGHVYNKNFAKELAEIAGKYDIEPRLLEIELTESVFCENSALVSDVIDSIHSYGFVVSIDDFGSGYSSLNMLKDTEFDSIKIDQVFFKGDIEKIKKVVRCILTLAKALGMKTVAEGVESVAQFNFLKENGCDVIQGFYFSKPVDEETFNQLL